MYIEKKNYLNHWRNTSFFMRPLNKLSTLNSFDIYHRLDNHKIALLTV